MKNKGFTLIELIAVIIIMGLILLIVSPSLSRLLQSGEEKKYTEYHDLVIKAAEKYSRVRESDLGGVGNSGCIEDITVSDLIKYDYLKEFNEDGVICGSPNEDRLLGVVNPGYIDIRINNDNGKIKVMANLVCIDKRKNVVYPKDYQEDDNDLIKKADLASCVAYKPTVKSTLYEGIKNITSVSLDGDVKYITGANPNNYVLYSGRLWRIISYNEKNRITKAILDEPVTYLNFDSESSNFEESNVKEWLNLNFLKTLRSPEVYLDNAVFDNSSVTNTNKPTTTTTYTSKVGLLSLYEYGKVKDYASISQSYFLSSKNGNNIWIAKPGKTEENVPVTTFSTIRPVIVFKGNVSFQTGGNGTKETPYKVNGEKTANPLDNLNSRYTGEYVKFANNIFRIIETNPNYTKLISADLLDNLKSVYANSGNTYSDYNVIGTAVSYNWYQNTLNDEDRSLIYLNTYCTDSFPVNKKYTSSCDNTINTNVSLPVIGGMYTTSISSEYFTMTPSSTDKVYAVGSSINEKDVTSESGVRVIISLKNDVKIEKGSGTLSDPYILNHNN